MQETSYKKIDKARYEEICRETCSLLYQNNIAQIDEDMLWCHICQSVCHFFGEQYFHENRELSK